MNLIKYLLMRVHMCSINNNKNKEKIMRKKITSMLLSLSLELSVLNAMPVRADTAAILDINDI